MVGLPDIGLQWDVSSCDIGLYSRDPPGHALASTMPAAQGGTGSSTQSRYPIDRFEAHPQPLRSSIMEPPVGPVPYHTFPSQSIFGCVGRAAIKQLYSRLIPRHPFGAPPEVALRRLNSEGRPGRTVAWTLVAGPRPVISGCSDAFLDGGILKKVGHLEPGEFAPPSPWWTDGANPGTDPSFIGRCAWPGAASRDQKEKFVANG